MVNKFQKYIPSSIEDIIGNQDKILEIENSIINFKKSIIVTGNHGIGKSSIVKLLLKKHNINFKIIFPDNVKEYRSNNLFKSYFNNNNLNKNTKLAFVFDEIEMISLGNERKFILSILKTNTKHNFFPIIFICNNNHSKLINDIKKISTIIKLSTPDVESIKVLIKTTKEPVQGPTKRT